MTMTRYHPMSKELWQRAVETTSVSFKANRLRAVQVHEFEGQAARVLAQGRLGHASTTDPEIDHGLLVDRALRAAQHGRPVGIVFPSTQLESSTTDATLSALSAADLVALGTDITAIIRQADPRAIVELDIRRSRERTHMHNSAGGAVSTSTSRLLVDAWVERHQGDEVLVVFDTFKTAHLEGGHRRFAERIAQRLTWATQPTCLTPSQAPVILSPLVVAVLIRPLILALSGARTLKRGNSPLTGKLGQRLFDPRLTLVDDGTLHERPNGGAVDHEGVPSQRTVLIRNGVLERFYYNCAAATLAGASSTGNGRREMLSPPRTQPTNIVLNAGQTSLEHMIASTGDGLLVDQLLGVSPASAMRGTFSRTIMLGYRIEHGRLAGYVKGAALAGNLYEMLNNVIALGDTTVWAGDIRAPYMQVSGLSVAV